MAYIPRFQNGSLADYTYDDSVTQPSLQNYLTAGYNQVNSELKRGAPMFSLMGQATTNMGVAPGFKPNPGLSMAGGAMQGAAAGGLLGAVAGGAMGFLQGANKRGEYENLQELYNRQKIQNSTVGQNYGYYAQHGGATPGAVASQTEVGEVVLFPDNMVANVMATKKHKQMDDDEVTDMLPEGSYVFSDDKAMRFNVKDVAEKILGYGMSYYDEHGNYETEEMEMEDFLPKKGRITFAEAAKFLRSKIKTTGNRKDLFDIHTDSENMETRVPYLMELISMQDEKNASAGRVGSMLEPEEEMPIMQFGGPGERAFAAGMGAAGLINTPIAPSSMSFLDTLDIPQAELMRLIMGQRGAPSEFLTGNELGSKLIGKDNYGLVADLIVDPLNLVPYMRAFKGINLAKGRKLKKLNNIEKLKRVGNAVNVADKIDDISDFVDAKILNKNQYGGPGERAFEAGMGVAGLQLPKEVYKERPVDKDLLGPIGEPGARAAQAAMSLIGLPRANEAAAAKQTRVSKSSPNYEYSKTLNDDAVLDRVYGLYDELGIADPASRAILMQESNGDPEAVSKSGYTGLYQLHKNTSAEDWNMHAKDHPMYKEIGKIKSNENLKDPKINATIGQWYLNERIPSMLRSAGLDEFAETKSMVAAAFNMGPNGLKKIVKANPKKANEAPDAYVRRIQKKLPKETRDYIDRFWMGYNRLQHPRQIEKKQFGSTWTIVD